MVCKWRERYSSIPTLQFQVAFLYGDICEAGIDTLRELACSYPRSVFFDIGVNMGS